MELVVICPHQPLQHAVVGLGCLVNPSEHEVDLLDGRLDVPVFAQKLQIGQARRSDLVLVNDLELPSLLLRIPPRALELVGVLVPVLGQIIGVLDFDQRGFGLQS